jgi:hypothetical protein
MTPRVPIEIFAKSLSQAIGFQVQERIDQSSSFRPAGLVQSDLDVAVLAGHFQNQVPGRLRLVRHPAAPSAPFPCRLSDKSEAGSGCS